MIDGSPVLVKKSSMHMRTDKARLPAMLLACALLSGCITFQHPKDRWFAKDKAGHFLSFGLMGAAAAAAAQHNDRSDVQTFFIGITASTGLGAVKEYVDEKPLHKYFSGKDLVFDFLGGVVGSLIVIEAN